MRVRPRLSLSAIGLAIIGALSGCTPAFEIFGSGPQPAPSGPKVADLENNLKCELWYATNSDYPLPIYRADNVPGTTGTTALKHLFSVVEYVAEANFLLEVTNTEGLNPRS